MAIVYKLTRVARAGENFRIDKVASIAKTAV